MKKISKPTITQDDICDSFKNLDYKDRIIEKSEEYDKNIYSVEKFLKEGIEFENNNIGFNQYMKNTYSNRFSSSNKSYALSYAIYRKLRNTVSICPYCNYFTRTVSQLDHYLPKSVFSTYSITANNLVPICKECNENKDNYAPNVRSEMLIHPYYDELANDIERFLKCKVVENFNIGFRFYIVKLDEWDDATYQRVKTHFELLKLDKLYDADFVGEFTDFMDYTTKILDMFDALNGDIIKELFQKKVESLKETNIKPWSISGFRSVLDSEWFMNVYIPWKCNF